MDETLVGECSFWKCVSYVDRTHAFAIVAAEINILDGARWRDALPKISVWYKRDIIFFKNTSIWCRRDDTCFFKCAFGVDETLVGKCNLLQRYVLRRRDARWRVQVRGKIEYLTH